MKAAPFHPPSGFASVQHEIELWWQRLPNAVRAPHWPMTLAVLTILALLLAFHQVVRDAVQQGEILRMATASHADAIWRCGALHGARMRDSCIAQLNAAPDNEAAALTEPQLATVAAVSPIRR